MRGRHAVIGGAPIRVLLFGEFPPPSGGISEQAWILENCLSQEGIIVRTCRTNLHWRGWFSFIEKVRVFRTLLKLPLIYWRFLVYLMRSEAVHVFSNSFLNFYLFSIPPVLLAKAFRRRTVLNYHGGAAAKFFQHHMAWLRPVFRLADSIIVPSQYLKEVFERHGLSAEVVPNIANLDRFFFEAREKFSPRFIVTRHLEREYGIEVVLKAFERIAHWFPEAELLVVGSGSQAECLKALAKEMRIAERVCFVGRMDNSALPGLYGRSDILLNASRIDNVPVSLIEAFASGVPVVSTRAGGIPYIVEDGVDGLLVGIDDAEAMAAGAHRILTDPELGKFLARNAKRKAESWSWQGVRSRVLRMYGVTEGCCTAGTKEQEERI